MRLEFCACRLTDRTSMPNIFISGKGVGGCNDGPGVATLQKSGELVPMLKAAGAL
jgi:glutaredoxin